MRVTDRIHERSGRVDRRGSCPFAQKVLEAQNAGAVAAIVCNHTSGGLITMGSGAFASSVTIPSVCLLRAECNVSRSASGPVEVALSDELRQPSYRWLLGADSSIGVIRDMWNSQCLAMPGRVGDDTYDCGAADNGGVPTNSGAPNQAFALLADGGIYHGETESAIGTARAAAI